MAAAAGVTPLRVVTPHPYSCKAIEPFNVLIQPQTLAKSGIPVTIVGLGWYEDPRGDCGACPACGATPLRSGIWATMYVVE